MSKPKALRLCVARGKSPAGYPWSLWFPRHTWEQLTPAEKQATIEKQAAILKASILWRLE